MSYELQKDLYSFEWERRNQLFTAMRLPQAVMLGVGGAILFVLRDISLSMLQHYPVKSFLLALAVIALLLDLVLYTMVFVSPTCTTYQQVGTPLALFKMYEEWREYHLAIIEARDTTDDAPAKPTWNDLPDKEKKRYTDLDFRNVEDIAIKDFQLDVARKMAEASSWNLDANSKRWELMNWGNKILTIAAVLTLITVALHHFDTFKVTT
ncbi:hypothetical protein SIID45300_00460 [Candidatus Magnetaquicoccaceae bacterium FCR-1]|uniref:SMODS and SLOG-associating 2TM effector domain-containing protein n=1 Tax=Candidatus Magnetaquiglobus chichijimensis TaxID=3141448 RepID=A0ABQ0C5I9_9PROT